VANVELRGYVVAFVLAGIPFFFTDYVWVGCLLWFLAFILGVVNYYSNNNAEEPLSFAPVVPPTKSLTALEQAQLDQLEWNRKIKACAEIILVWTDQMKSIKGNLNLIFSDELLRDQLREDADKLHLAMNYLEEKGLAKRAAPGYWKVR
jgi:hypothetical protein